jgi:hypothetical protein
LFKSDFIGGFCQSVFAAARSIVGMHENRIYEADGDAKDEH